MFCNADADADVNADADAEMPMPRFPNGRLFIAVLFLKNRICLFFVFALLKLSLNSVYIEISFNTTYDSLEVCSNWTITGDM